ncbi:MAG: glycosyltransferase family 2 protein [Bacilli bacterium]|nr:glycosyltransferase family 2 protein [Bacilli bacterium]
MARSKNIKIAGVVTLYNPTDQDIENINTYLKDIDKLYVIDNTEGYNNEARIPKSKKIKYQFKNENIGVATALNMGAKFAIKEGYSYLLTMDQDTTFKPGVMERLKEAINKFDMKKVGIITPWHNTKVSIAEIDEEYDYPPTIMTSGNILNLDIWKKLGGFKDEFFIDGIDIEYSLNLRKHGYQIVRVVNAKIDHELGDIQYKKLFGKTYLCSNYPAIRRYYIMRNNHYIFDMYKDFDPNICWSLLEQKKHMKSVLLFEKDKFRKIRNYFRGLRDYKKGIKGKYPYKN